jgi:hypothetical protein
VKKEVSLRKGSKEEGSVQAAAGVDWESRRAYTGADVDANQDMFKGG